MSELPAAIVVRENLQAMSRAAAERVIHLATEVVALRGACSIALSGGNTPATLYALLAAPPLCERMPWPQVQVYWGDERCVPPDDPASNYGLAWRTLLAQVALQPEQLHRIAGEDPDPAAAAARYAQELPAALDLLLLGVGEDGHIASLFPNSPALHEQTLRAVAVTAPKPPPCRITITPPVIAAARHLLVLAAGAEKAEAVTHALSGAEDIDHVPAQLARHGLWYLDQAAAAGLGWA